MHKVKFGPNDKGAYVYKETCPNKKCIRGKGLNWVYPIAFKWPVCTYCKSDLQGRMLMQSESTRIKYHLINGA